MLSTNLGTQGSDKAIAMFLATSWTALHRVTGQISNAQHYALFLKTSLQVLSSGVMLVRD